MASDFVVQISDSSPRAVEWRQVLGTTELAVHSPLPAWVNLPGRGRQQAYMLDLALLTSEQRGALIDHLALKFGIPRGEVATEIDAAGVPILAEDVSVAVHRPQRWLP